MERGCSLFGSECTRYHLREGRSLLQPRIDRLALHRQHREHWVAVPALGDHIRWYPTHDNHSQCADVSTDTDLVLAVTRVNPHFEWAFLPRLTNS
jgi:hypothetical protein